MTVADRIWGILHDDEIKQLCNPDLNDRPMLDPFIAAQMGAPSYGLGSFGYDVRLGRRFMQLKRHEEDPWAPLDPLDASEDWEEFIASEHAGWLLCRDAIVMPPGAVWLAETVEWFNMPDDVMGICYGKSSYARCGLLVNAVPIEPGWRGRLTLELKNLNADRGIRLYLHQGIAQVVFFRGMVRPNRTYEEKEAGKAYQDQPGVMPAKAGGDANRWFRTWFGQ